MSLLDLVARALAVLGLTVVAVSALGLLVVRPVLASLHLVSAVTSVGVPLLALGLAIEQGFTLGAAAVLLTGAVVAFSAPALGAETARLAGEREGVVLPREPVQEPEPGSRP
ncbi:MAG: monovalent cation/H(+) antiporter subunit G [Motilibacteraceae bacterium]